MVSQLVSKGIIKMRKIIKLNDNPTDAWEVIASTLLSTSTLAAIQIRPRDIILCDYGKPTSACFRCNDYEFDKYLKKAPGPPGFYRVNKRRRKKS